MTVPIPHHHRPHVHIPWSPIASVVVVAAAVIALILVVAVEHPWSPAVSGSGGPTAAVTSAGQAAAIPLPEPQAMLRHPAGLGATGQETVRQETVRQATVKTTVSQRMLLHHHGLGVTWDLRSAGDVQPPAPRYLPGSVANPHPLNVVAGAPQ